MWVLQSLNNDSYYYLWEKTVYTLGRKHCDIIINNDESISRSHASIEIKNNEVYVTDNASKYGTFLNLNRLKAKEAVNIKENAVIHFGILDKEQSKFRFNNINFNVVMSNVHTQDKENLRNALQILKATRASSWDFSCTHVVVSDVLLTMKVLCALTIGQHIVGVKYFTDYAHAVKNNLAAPKVENYIPKLNETLLSKNIKLEYNPERKILFKNKIFIFLTEKYRSMIQQLITVTGGKSCSWEKKQIEIHKLKNDFSPYLLVEEAFEDVDKNSQLYESYKDVIKHLSKLGRRSIPSQEIPLAIIHNSCSEYCNPLFNRAALLIPKNESKQTKPETIFGYDTQYSSTSQHQSQNSVAVSQNLPIIEPSFDSENIRFSKESHVKRTLDDDSTPFKLPPKRQKQDISTASSSIEKSTNQSTQVSTSKLLVHEILNSSSNNAENEGNPFNKKRKASTDCELTLEVKKRSTEISEINTCTSWISKTIIKKKENVKKEPEDEEFKQFNELFKNCVKIDYEAPIINAHKKIDTTLEQTIQENYKLFKKIHQNIQTEIIPEDDIIVTIVNNFNEENPPSDDEGIDSGDEGLPYESIVNNINTSKQNMKKTFSFK